MRSVWLQAATSQQPAAISYQRALLKKEKAERSLGQFD
jgi:hypothetical protein